MLFHKSLISFVVAIALAGSVTASATPVRRNNPGCSPGTGSQTCCTSTTSFGSLTIVEQIALSILDGNLNDLLPVGLNCVLAGAGGCNNNALCCDAIQNQLGLINIAANCITA